MLLKYLISRWSQHQHLLVQVIWLALFPHFLSPHHRSPCPWLRHDLYNKIPPTTTICHNRHDHASPQSNDNHEWSIATLSREWRWKNPNPAPAQIPHGSDGVGSRPLPIEEMQNFTPVIPTKTDRMSSKEDPRSQKTQCWKTSSTTIPKDESSCWVDSTAYSDRHHHNIYEQEMRKLKETLDQMEKGKRKRDDSIEGIGSPPFTKEVLEAKLPKRLQASEVRELWWNRQSPRLYPKLSGNHDALQLQGCHPLLSF